jgi:hypothetical protein
MRNHTLYCRVIYINLYQRERPRSEAPTAASTAMSDTSRSSVSDIPAGGRVIQMKGFGTFPEPSHFITENQLSCWLIPKFERPFTMKVLMAALAASALLAGAAGSAAAQGYASYGHDDHSRFGQDQGGSHHWQRGERMGYNDWSSAAPVDYRQHHLRQPPRGYEWRESNGQYVLAAVATGLIASMIINSGR